MLVKLVDFVKTSFTEHFRRMIKSRKIDNFLYQHSKHTNHSPPSPISIQPVEKIFYDGNSTKNIGIFSGKN